MMSKFDQPLSWIGSNLVRPECVLVNSQEHVFVSDFRGGVTQIFPDGTQAFYGGEHPRLGPLKTNGFALLEDGSFLVAHLGAETGGVFRVFKDGQIDDWLTHVDGEPLPPTNFVYLDHQGRIWITVSTRTQPRANAYRKSCEDGFIVLVDDKGARIVADGLGYTNELWVNPEGDRLYVNATFTRELIQYRIEDDCLVNPSVVCTFGPGTFPDGLTMDEEGFLWVTSIVSNRIIRISPNGTSETWLEDANPAHLEWVEAAYQSDTMGRPHLDGNPAETLRNTSSLAFGKGYLYIGSLLDTRVVRIKTDIRGIMPAHWDFE